MAYRGRDQLALGTAVRLARSTAIREDVRYVRSKQLDSALGD